MIGDVIELPVMEGALGLEDGYVDMDEEEHFKSEE